MSLFQQRSFISPVQPTRSINVSRGGQHANCVNCSNQSLTTNSRPTHFLESPEHTMSDLFVTNQATVSRDKQLTDEMRNTYTQTVNINIDSQDRDFEYTDYLDFISDERNTISQQGKWLNSYLFPNNFRISLNRQYNNIKTVRLTSTVFENARSREVIYIDDTNNHFFIRAAMAAPWLSLSYHVCPSMNLIDYDYMSCSAASKPTRCYKFFQSIEDVYGIPRNNITDDTINGVVISNKDEQPSSLSIRGLLYHATLSGDVQWVSDIMNPTFATTVATTGSTRTYDAVLTAIIANADTNPSPTLYYATVQFTVSDNVKIDPTTNESIVVGKLYTMTCTIDIDNDFLFAIENESVDMIETPGQDIIIEVVDTVPTEINDYIVYVYKREDMVRYYFNDVTFAYISAFNIQFILNFNFSDNPVSPDYQRVGDLLLTLYLSDITDQFNSILLNGSVTDIEIVDSAESLRLVTGLLNGTMYINAVSYTLNILSGTVTLHWLADDGVSMNEFVGYIVSNIHTATYEGWTHYISVLGTATYITTSLGLLNNINIYRDVLPHEEGPVYYGTFAQGIPQTITDQELDIYVRRAIHELIGVQVSDFADALYASDSFESEIVIEYGEYTLDSLVEYLSKQTFRVHSIQNILTTDFITVNNVNYAFYAVYHLNVHLSCVMEYVQSSYLMKFNVESVEVLDEPITIASDTFTYTWTPTEPVCAIYCIQTIENANGELVVQSISPLSPFEVTFSAQEVDSTVRTATVLELNANLRVQPVMNGFVYNISTSLYDMEYVFPIDCEVRIRPRIDLTECIIYPPLPTGFTIASNGVIQGRSVEPFNSYHFVYAVNAAGSRVYQNIQLINLPFQYNYSTIQLLMNTAFTGIQQTDLSINNMSIPYINIEIEGYEIPVTSYDIHGITITKYAGSIYGTPTSEFTETLHITATFNTTSFNNVEILEGDVTKTFDLTIVVVNADTFYGDSTLLYFAYNYYNDASNTTNFLCWAYPVTIQLRDFVSFHVFANDRVSRQLLDELHFNYSDSSELLQTDYLATYYEPSQVLTYEVTQLPDRFAWTKSTYTPSLYATQVAQTELLNTSTMTENASIYPLRHYMFGYALERTREIDTYDANNASSELYDPTIESIANRLWYAIPIYVVNEYNGFIYMGAMMSQYMIPQWTETITIDNVTYRVYVPEGAVQVNTTTNVSDRVDPTATQYLNILNIKDIIDAVNSVGTIDTPRYSLYNRTAMVPTYVQSPVPLLKGFYDSLTIPEKYLNNNLLSFMLTGVYNSMNPSLDTVLAPNDYYNFQDFLWLQLSVENYGEFENIYDPYTNRWYFAKIFFKHCDKRYDVSYNYFECPTYYCKKLNYIQELNSLSVRVYDRAGNLFPDYNTVHYNFSFTLEIEYFVDDIRANGVNTMRNMQAAPAISQDYNVTNPIYPQELSMYQRMNG